MKNQMGNGEVGLLMADLKPYDALRDSGLPWCPQLPSHWELKPNRAILRQRKVLVGARYPEYTLLSLTKQGVIVRDLSENKGKFSSDMGTSQEVRPGDLVMCLFDVPETPRTVGLATDHGMITGAYTVFELLDGVNPAWLEKFYISMDDRKMLSPLYSGLRNTIPAPRFLATKTPIPPPEEQAAIGRYLDYVDRRVRRLVRAKRKLIELLTEQRQTIIHRAVTRGLDPGVPLRDSGLPWCPQLPSHWELKSNRAILRQRKVLVGARYPEYTLLSLTKQGVIVRDLSENKGKFSSDMGTSQEVRPGDLVMCLFDVPETPRTVGLATDHGMITGAYTVFELLDGVNPAWLEKFYISMDDRKMLSPLYSGLRNTIPAPRFLATKTPIPPPSEQAHITEYLNDATAEIETIESRALREIELLDECRARLSADVVTGKLDVREAAAALLGVDPSDAEDNLEDALDLDVENDLEGILEEAEA